MNQSAKRNLIIALSALLLVPLAALFFFGGDVPSASTDNRASTPEAKKASVDPPTAVVPQEVVPRASSPAAPAPARVEPIMASNNAPTSQAKARLMAAVRSLADLIRHGDEKFHFPLQDPNGDEQFAALRAEILEALKEEPELLSLLLDGFLSKPASLMGTEIGAILSEFGGDDVQSAMLELGLDSEKGPTNRMSALNVLINMDEVSKDTRYALLDSFDSEEDNATFQASLMALGTPKGDESEIGRVNLKLNEVVHNDDPNVRRHAASQIGNWATETGELSVLRDMTATETDVNARSKAAMSLSESPHRSSENKSTLLAYVADDAAPPSARRYVAERLQAYELDADEQAQLARLNAEVEQAYAAELAAEGGP